MAENFCLKWKDFQINVSNTFRKLRTSDDFYDVTLVSDDQQQVSAHKVVLSSSSEYFKNILTANKHSHPMLCLTGVNAVDLKNILDFIYNGELQIYQDHLDQFLETAHRFQLEGLSQEKEETNYDGTEPFDEKPFLENDNMVEIKDFGNITVKTTKEKIISVQSVNYQDIEELDETIEEMMEKVDGTWKCTRCGKMCKRKGTIREHIETHIDGLNFPCQFCDKTFRSRHVLRDHIVKKRCSGDTKILKNLIRQLRK